MILIVITKIIIKQKMKREKNTRNNHLLDNTLPLQTTVPYTSPQTATCYISYLPIGPLLLLLPLLSTNTPTNIIEIFTKRMIIIFWFYIALITSIMSLSALEILFPQSSDSHLSAHNGCTFSTPWGAFQSGAILQTLTMRKQQ